MSSTIDDLKSRFSQCSRDSCEAPGCRLVLKDFPKKKLILDIDCVAGQGKIKGKRCDHIIVARENKVMFLLSVEFKKGFGVPGRIKEQLEGGRAFFQEYHQGQFTFFPILVSKKLDRKRSKQLQKVVIEHGKRKLRIAHVPCNQRLSWSQVKRQGQG